MVSRTQRILIIDSDASARAELSRYLEVRGFYALGYSNPSAAIALYDGPVPDIIFADLPPDAIREVANHFEDSEYFIPIVACAEQATGADVVAVMRAGASDFLLKPCNSDRNALDDVIAKLLERARINRLNQLYRQELEDANRELRSGMSELSADHRAGRKVQMKMLPEHNMEVNGVVIDHLIKPSLFLSGDFLDYFKLTDDKVMVYIADVSGHGASSAFVTVLLKNLTSRLRRDLRRGFNDEIMHPELFLQRINSELLDTGLGKHVTIFMGIIDLKTRVLSYTVGAHLPMPIIAFEDQPARFLEGSGLPVGLFEEPEWKVFELALTAPFRLLMFSDGILEVIPAKSLDEKERTLLELVSGGRHTIASLSEALNLDETTELPDDIAMVSVTDMLRDSANPSS
ncbi:PP2C family protein-serine/threonine phosphatase [Marinobacter sp. BSs20148]|uniref:PP2C family protein-serine/threonine phosphatase n=1 Tax=Marinobacter sp. BSs20148 TaxID=490759 RepID=UPI00027769E7|nr:SpoIIE family protein phosphatase [Marinobacter sp. BSs20148]AFP31005.1 Phosphoserine phosphatase rsbP [Marinobacter sp. BSs20148]